MMDALLSFEYPHTTVLYIFTQLINNMKLCSIAFIRVSCFHRLSSYDHTGILTRTNESDFG